MVDSHISTSIKPILGSKNRFGVDLIPGHPGFSIIEDRLGAAWHDVLGGDIGGIRKSNWNTSLCHELRDQYDLAFFDLGPSLGSINRCVLIGCDHFLTPMGADIFSILGVRNIATWIDHWLGLYSKSIDLSEQRNPGRLLAYGISTTPKIDKGYLGYCRTGLAKDGYNVCKYYEQHLVNDLRSPVRLIVKAHGCVSDPSKIVLTRSQYFAARQDAGNFYSVLDALFLTHTLLFIGYSLSDPDIQLVLENATIAARCAHTHYALVEDNMPPEVEAAAAKAYNIHFLKYAAGQHDLAEIALKELEDAVTQFRVSNPS